MDATKIGRLLVKQKIITEEQLGKALQHIRQHGGKLSASLSALRLLDETERAAVLAQEYGIAAVDLERIEVDYECLTMVPLELMVHFLFVPLFRVASSLTVALADPSDNIVISGLELKTGLDVEPVIATPSAIRAALERAFGGHWELWTDSEGCFRNLPTEDLICFMFGSNLNEIRKAINEMGIEQGHDLRVQVLTPFLTQKSVTEDQAKTAITRQQNNELLMARFHNLVDKRLEGKASQEELVELQWIEKALSATDERQMTEIPGHLEAQHEAAIQKLAELISALKELPENPGQQTDTR